MNMNKNGILSRIGAFALTACMALAPTTAMAEYEDIIDTTRKGSINLYKYDFTAATEDGVDVTQWKATGERNCDVEDAMERYQIEGVEFTYAKVANINTHSENGEVEILYDIPKELQEALGLSDKAQYNSTEISKALNDALLSKPTETRNTLEDYMRGVSNRQTMTTDGDGHAAATNLNLGLYLIVETKVPANVQETVEPFFVSVPMTDVTGSRWFYDITAYPKNQTDIPTLDKLVRQHDDAKLYNKPAYDDTATGSEGDKMDYIFVSRIPKIDSKSTYLTQYDFVDIMDKGLSYNKDVEIYFYDNEADAKANATYKAVKNWERGSECFTVEYDGANSDYNKMTVTPTRKGLEEINPALAEKYIVISYSATMNSDDTPVLGDVGNVNNVTLTWRRTNMRYTDMLKDRARVFTFGINLKKEFEENVNADSNGSPVTPDATKVQFVLKNKTDGHYITARQQSKGLYYVTDATKGTTEADGTVFSPNADGSLVIEGLEANEYVLTETHTAPGYSLLKEPITINITCTDDDITATRTTLYDSVDIATNPYKNIIDVRRCNASAKVDGSDTAMSSDGVKNITSDNALVNISVINNVSFKLPMTGGTGTILFTLGGCVLALGGVALITSNKKKKQSVN